jgi:hypothetical protein
VRDRIVGNVYEVVRLDTLETVDARPATKEELRSRDYQTTIFDHGADAPAQPAAPEPQPEATAAEVIEAEVIEPTSAPWSKIVVRLDTLETVDARPATKEELRSRDYQTTIFDHGADAPAQPAAPEPQPEATTAGVIEAEVIESTSAPLAIEAKETEEETTPDLEEVPLRVSPSLLQTILSGKAIDWHKGSGGTVFRHGGSHYIVDTLKESGDATAYRVKMADLYTGETSEFNRYASTGVGQIVTDTEGEKWVIIADTVYNVTTQIKAEAA